MSDPVTALMVVSMTAEGVGMYAKYTEQEAAAKAKLDTLKLQSQQSTIKNQQETISNYNILEKTIATQEAQASAKGVGLGSLSFEAIQRDTINKSAEAGKNLEIEEGLFQRGIDIEKANVKRSLSASLFGDISNTVFDFAKVVNPMIPKK